MKRRIDAHGGIKIPAELRKQLGWRPNDDIELAVFLDRLVLTKAVPCCIFCHTAINLARIGNYYICGECIQLLQQAGTKDIILPINID